METDFQGHTKSLAPDTGSLGQGKGSRGMLSQQKRGPSLLRDQARSEETCRAGKTPQFRK